MLSENVIETREDCILYFECKGSITSIDLETYNVVFQNECRWSRDFCGDGVPGDLISSSDGDSGNFLKVILIQLITVTIAIQLHIVI